MFPIQPPDGYIHIPFEQEHIPIDLDFTGASANLEAFEGVSAITSACTCNKHKCIVYFDPGPNLNSFCTLDVICRLVSRHLAQTKRF
jgi:hypothetical protein